MPPDKFPCLLGAHFSIAKGLYNALIEAGSYGCTSCQIFTKSSGTWKEKILSDNDIQLFDKARKITGITAIASHASYLINLASPDDKKHGLSVKALQQELIRSSTLNIPFVVLHPGSHMEMGEKKGIRKISESIKYIFNNTKDLKIRLLLETTAGQGSGLGYTFEHLSSIIKKIDNKTHIGICLDTSHIFAAGYDIRTPSAYKDTMDSFESTIGIENLFFIHLNDSKKKLGTKVDRHEHIGEGMIGLKAFEMIMNDPRLKDIPKIIETPKLKGKKDFDKINLKKLVSLMSNQTHRLI